MATITAAKLPQAGPGASGESAQGGQIQTQTRRSLFDHLPSFDDESQRLAEHNLQASSIHPVFTRLALHFAAETYKGSTARCVALLSAFREFLLDYKSTGNNKVISRDLRDQIAAVKRYLQKSSHAMSVSMNNAFAYLTQHSSRLKVNATETEAREYMIERIESFYEKRIEAAARIIAEKGADKIRDGDVILTYGYSGTVKQTLLEARARGREFRVIMVDARPYNDGRLMLKPLTENGIHCTYTTLNALTYVIRSATKVFVGAHAMLGNGAAYARAGTAVVALAASAAHLPFIVCCEVYKFTDRVLLEGLSHNERGPASALIVPDTLRGKELPKLASGAAGQLDTILYSRPGVSSLGTAHVPPRDLDVSSILWSLPPGQGPKGLGYSGLSSGGKPASTPESTTGGASATTTLADPLTALIIKGAKDAASSGQPSQEVAREVLRGDGRASRTLVNEMVRTHGGSAEGPEAWESDAKETKANEGSTTLQIVNLNFDVTPLDLINVVVTDVGIIPPTAVPAILREYHTDTMMNI